MSNGFTLFFSIMSHTQPVTRENIREILQEMREESQRMREESKERSEKMERESKERLERIDKESKERLERMDRESKEMNKRLEWIWLTQADIAEDVFYRSMKSMLRNKWMSIDFVIRNIEWLTWAEYDVIAVNGTELVVTEVKTKLRDRDVKDFLTRKIAQFKLDFPEYKWYTIYGWVAGLAVPDDVEKYAEKSWLFVFTQHGDHGAMIANSPDFVPKAL